MDNKWIKSSLDVIRGILYALVISVFMVLGLALLIKLTSINSNVVMYINQGIKVVSMLLGIFFGTKEMNMGAAKGSLAGLLYVLLSFLVFKLLAGQEFSLSIFDVLLGVVIGLLSGILTVNVKSSNK